jgi:hypothetical protein
MHTGRRKGGIETETRFSSGDGNADEDLVIFIKTQRMLLDELLHIFILLLLKTSKFLALCTQQEFT